MKLSEFEEKLTTVSDSKLGRMLANSRQNGPEVAVNLIKAEMAKRGMNPDEESSGGAGAEPSVAGAEAVGGEEAMPEISGEAETSEGGAPKGAWLQEEVNSGMPMFLKVLIVLVILAAALGGLFFLLNKGG